MSKRLTHARLARAGIASAVIAAAVIVAIFAGALSGGGKSQAAAPMSMTVTNSSNVAVGSTFVATVTVGNPGVATWGGYSMELGYTPSVVSVVSTADGGLATCTFVAGNWANPQNTPTVQTGCAFQNGTLSGPSDLVTFQCVAPGTTALTLIDKIIDPISGSSMFDTSAVDIATDLFNSSVTCSLPITKSVSAGPYLAGGSVTYTVHVGNPTAVSVGGQIVGDIVPAPLNNVAIVSSTNGIVTDGCTVAVNTVSCVSATAQPDPVGFDVVISADIPLSAAGTNNVVNCAQVDPLNGGPVSCKVINIAPSSLTVTKVAGAPQYQATDPISWTIQVNSTGPSPATGVVVTDVAPIGFSIVTAATAGPCVSGPVGTWNCGTMASGASQVLTVTGFVNDPVPGDTTCRNSATATSTNGPAATQADATAICLSRNVQMQKHTVGEIPSTGGGTTPQVNLWLCKAPAPCTNNGEGSLLIEEQVFNVNGDPDGVGAFEFQLKYDNHLFDITITETNWLYATGRVPGALGIGGCAATILTENDIRFGCVSKNPVDINGDPVITIGNTVNGTVANIVVTPKADLVNRITPGNDNGAIRTLLNEGCELADIWGHPLANGLDLLGREKLLPGVLPGGLIADCGDITITIRILEGDMNLDCEVDVVDDQIEASHYGSFFGHLLYQPWYDLEPGLKDGDVDIKDLQKVFGRNGSTCANPVPAQPPLPEPIDP